MRSLKTRALGAAAVLFVAVGVTAACSKESTAETAMTEAAAPAMTPETEPVVMVGGAAMYPTKTIVENAMNSADHTTLVAAVKAAGLVETLSSPGPFTVFAPTNAAFGKLPAGTVETLVKPESKAALTKILTYHVVAGKMSGADIMAAIEAGGGKAMLTTVQGETLTATKTAAGVELTDAKGGKAMVTIADVNQSNGVIHVVDTVLMPK
ncbi:MAG: fasciclin domain-containing protein [Caulobacteraceae bacterium]|nr:MAG: fasciclin domain-containing protein [Caulobacteraceae bacterium]